MCLFIFIYIININYGSRLFLRAVVHQGNLHICVYNILSSQLSTALMIPEVVNDELDIIHSALALKVDRSIDILFNRSSG